MKIEALIGMTLIALTMFWTSYRRGDLTGFQASQNGIKGFSAISHTGLWGVLLIIPTLCGVIWTYEESWTHEQLLPALVVGAVINHLMHTLWLFTSPDDHNLNHGSLTRAGKLHYLFMFFTLASVTLFYFCTPEVSSEHLLSVSMLLGVYVTMNTLVLNLIRQKKLDVVALLTTLVVWGVLLYQLWKSAANT
ncbi:hypothetical protein HON36_02820 [Candidatus Parcubacteria bacterium]|jgi:hypothetical protein|nr:hypothetical protein [Candidatus Parcubacteria bacterium]MBT7228555.1 hypothetical protein [Candidatus Parcubacteria bacterium]